MNKSDMTQNARIAALEAEVDVLQRQMATVLDALRALVPEACYLRLVAGGRERR